MMEWYHDEWKYLPESPEQTWKDGLMSNNKRKNFEFNEDAIVISTVTQRSRIGQMVSSLSWTMLIVIAVPTVAVLSMCMYTIWRGYGAGSYKRIDDDDVEYSESLQCLA